MDGSLWIGRRLFAIAMVCFGIQFFIFVTAMGGPPPGPPWSRGELQLDWLACAGFVVAGFCIVTGKLGRLAATTLGVVMLVYVLSGYVPALLARPHDPGPWTVVFEILAMVGGSWVLAASFPADQRIQQPDDRAAGMLAMVGRYLIAVSLVVFAVQHFLYAGFVAPLVPAWIPGHIFWAYFTGLAFIAAALAIVANKMMGVATMLLGTMFLLWVVVLHVPRVAGAPQNGDEVTSLFVALAMSGVGFILAGAIGNRLEGRRV
jgi:hypothetical protein